MPRIPSSVFERAIMRQKARLDAERAIRMRQQHSNDIMNRFRPTDEELDEIIRIEDIERRNSRIPHYLPNDARSGGYEPIPDRRFYRNPDPGIYRDVDIPGYRNPDPGIYRYSDDYEELL